MNAGCGNEFLFTCFFWGHLGSDRASVKFSSLHTGYSVGPTIDCSRFIIPSPQSEPILGVGVGVVRETEKSRTGQERQLLLNREETKTNHLHGVMDLNNLPSISLGLPVFSAGIRPTVVLLSSPPHCWFCLHKAKNAAAT